MRNPERGFYRQLSSVTDYDNLVKAPKVPLWTLVEWHLWLSSAGKRKLTWLGNGHPDTSPELKKYAAELQEWRKRGVKVIIRPRYDVKGTGSSKGVELDSGLTVFHAATREMQLNHIDEVAKMLRDNRDAIGAIQAGYLGCWGEWNTAGKDPAGKKFSPANAPFLYNEPDRRAIVDRILSAYGGNTSNGLLQPVEMRTPLFAEEALRRNARANVGFHNDCFMSTSKDGVPDDYGTYLNFPGSPANILQRAGESSAEYEKRVRQEWMRKARVLTATKSFGGETCPSDGINERWRKRADMYSEPAMLHMNYLNHDYATGAAKLWMDNHWYEDIASSLGYRFEVQQVEYTKTVKTGENVTVIVDVKNTGWAHLHNPRRAQLFLRKESSTWTTPVPFGALNGTGATARWAPGAGPTRVMFSQPAPAAGTYTVHLAIFDPAAEPRWNKNVQSPSWTYAYAVRLASRRGGKYLFNAGTDDKYTGATGMNNLGIRITVQ
ncbi:DUF4832 domain-containing protein [Kocuria nitroreducens]|uniref:DUF4832 domain-containing protein n=1 Tax=Kocuria nitroreducens TaxID=3058914 RepID=UPI0036DBDE3F